jgi:hypothetical protein
MPGRYGNRFQFLAYRGPTLSCVFVIPFPSTSFKCIVPAVLSYLPLGWLACVLIPNRLNPCAVFQVFVAQEKYSESSCNAQSPDEAWKVATAAVSYEVRRLYRHLSLADANLDSFIEKSYTGRPSLSLSCMHCGDVSVCLAVASCQMSVLTFSAVRRGLNSPRTRTQYDTYTFPPVLMSDTARNLFPSGGSGPWETTEPEPACHSPILLPQLPLLSLITEADSGYCSCVPQAFSPRIKAHSQKRCLTIHTQSTNR